VEFHERQSNANDSKVNIKTNRLTVIITLYNKWNWRESMKTYSIICEKEKLCWLSAIGRIDSVKESEVNLSRKVYVEFSSYYSKEEIAQSVGDLTIDGLHYHAS